MAVEEVMAAEVMAAEVMVVHISVVAGMAAAHASAAGLRYRGLPRGPVSAVTVRLQSTVVRTGPPAAGQR
jgi:hypothetical protein